MKRCLLIISVIALLLLGVQACQAPSSQATVIIQTVVVPATAVLAAATNTTAPEASPTSLAPTSSLPVTGETDTPPLPTQTSGPQCVVLKNTNFRKGPGTAFQPPLRVLQTGAQLVPQGFQPQGFPAGSWVQVLEPQENEVGWIINDPLLVSCNLDLTTLPRVAVAPPPPPPAPVISNSQVDGEPNGLDGSVEFSPNFLMRMKVRDPNGSSDGDGIQRVTFSISDQSGTVYQRTENSAGYCIFGGGEPDCNPWTQLNGQYYWEEGGQAVKEGVYNVLIVAEPTSAGGDEGLFGRWFFDITIQLY